MTPRQDRVVYLFYDGYEVKAMPGLFGGAYSRLRGLARRAWRTLRRRQVYTGFYTAFLGLKRSLEAVGCQVRVNDFEGAARRPDLPVGLAGYPSVLSKVDLPNPIVFGPGDYGSEDAARRLAANARTGVLTQPCQWAVDCYRPWVGEKGAVYFAGIDTAAWPDLSDRAKTVDFLVYDKIRWHRDEREAAVLEACLDVLTRRGLTYTVLRYGHHHISQFRHELDRCAAMLFLCEHETQGLAYQEAMSTGMPVLAWDDGVLVDPAQKQFAPPGLTVSSVPYFDARCGLRFTMTTFAPQLEAFMEARSRYRPRAFVEEELSLERSGRLYLTLLEAAAKRASRPTSWTASAGDVPPREPRDEPSRSR